MSGDELLTATELASKLKVHPCTISRMNTAGQLPKAMNLPGLRGQRWSRREVDDWITAGMPEQQVWENQKKDTLKV